MVVVKNTCNGCEFKNTKRCPYFGPNEPLRIAECDGKTDLQCIHYL